MRPALLIHDAHIIELDIEKLVDAAQGAAQGDVVLQLDSDVVLHEGFEEGEEEHLDGVVAVRLEKWEVRGRMSRWRLDVGVRH